MLGIQSRATRMNCDHGNKSGDDIEANLHVFYGKEIKLFDLGL